MYIGGYYFTRFKLAICVALFDIVYAHYYTLQLSEGQNIKCQCIIYEGLFVSIYSLPTNLAIIMNPEESKDNLLLDFLA